MGILSRSKRFHFFHIYKNAGSSIANLLKQYGTPLTNDDAFRQYMVEKHPCFIYHNHGSLDSHYSAAQARNYLGAEEYHQVLNFAVIRNPWDWMVSLYAYIKQSKGHYQHGVVKEMSFRQFLEFERNRGITQADFVCDCYGNIIVDHLIRFESIDKDIIDLTTSLNLPSERISHHNKSNHLDYKYMYGPKEKDIVAEICKRDISIFKYEYNT